MENVRLYFLIVFAGISFCFAWGVTGSELLGLELDEARPMGAAIAGLEGIKNGDFAIFGPARWMRYDYAGVFKDYVLVPVFAVAGSSVLVMRVVWMVFACCAVLFMFLVTGRWFGWLEATIACVLFATNATYIRAARRAAAREEIFMTAFLWFTLWLFYKSECGRRRFFVFATFFVCGVAFWTKIVFGIYMFCFIPVALIFWRDFLLFLDRGKNAVLGTVAFLLGSAPFFIGNYFREFITFQMLLDRGERAGIDGKLDFILLRFEHLGELLFGALDIDGVFCHIFDYAGFALFVVSFACVVGLCVFGYFKETKRKTVLALLLYGPCMFMFLFSPPCFVGSEQTVILIWFVPLIVGVFSAWVFRHGKMFSKAVLVAVMLVYLVTQQWMLVDVDRRFESGKYVSFYHAVMRSCTRYALGNGIDRIVCNANVLEQLRCHSAGQVKQVCFWWCHQLFYNSWGYWNDYVKSPHLKTWEYWRPLLEKNTASGPMYVIDMFPLKFWKLLKPQLDEHGYGYELEKTFWVGMAPVKLYKVWRPEGRQTVLEPATG